MKHKNDFTLWNYSQYANDGIVFISIYRQREPNYGKPDYSPWTMIMRIGLN